MKKCEQTQVVGCGAQDGGQHTCLLSSYNPNMYVTQSTTTEVTPPGQPIGVTVHSTQQPIREQLLISKPRQKLLKIYHPDEAQKPRLPDPIVQPIAVMPLSRTRLNVSRSVVHRLWNQYQTEASVSRRHIPGLPRAAIPAGDRFIALSAHKRRRISVPKLFAETTL
ncbi:hypothetical protein TNCV_4363431 [Trichonephila clavipes]|nr:hypothetical protein TNCV_4363431 [Trichonephila clavipes]